MDPWSSSTVALVALHGMTDPSPELPSRAQAVDRASIERHFDGHEDILPLWIAEPYVALAPAVTTALADRAGTGWYGYETRSDTLDRSIRAWMARRHGWHTMAPSVVSPSVGTSIGVVIDLLTDPGDGVVIQPPVFTDFKPLIAAAGRQVVRNPLQLEDGAYRMDLEGLDEVAKDPRTKLLILCNPHNPVGRVWAPHELAAVAEVCARHDVVVVADEIHGDLALPHHPWTPFGTVVGDGGPRWASIHGPTKTFGLAGVCDTLLVSSDVAILEGFERRSSRFHLTRNNVFGLAAMEAAYEEGGSWLDGLMDLVEANANLLQAGLPDDIRLVGLEGTYLAWLDLRRLDPDIGGMAGWLAREASIAVSPGHWFGREGAGFARLTIAVPPAWIEQAIEGLRSL